MFLAIKRETRPWYSPSQYPKLSLGQQFSDSLHSKNRQLFRGNNIKYQSLGSFAWEIRMRYKKIYDLDASGEPRISNLYPIRNIRGLDKHVYLA